MDGFRQQFLSRPGFTVNKHCRARLRGARRHTEDAQQGLGMPEDIVETVFLVCDETGDYNYALRRKSGGEKLKLSKYSPRLRKHTPHTEKKK